LGKGLAKTTGDGRLLRGKAFETLSKREKGDGKS